MNKEAMYKAERLFGHSWRIASPHCACWYMHEALMKAQHVSVCPRSRFLRVAHLDVFCMFMMSPYIYAMWVLHHCVHMCARQTGEVATGCSASLCSPVIRPDLRLARAHQEECLVAHFLCSQWRWDLFTIFTQGIMMFDLTLFWVCLCKGYFHPLLPLREKTDRSLRSLFMDDAGSVYFCAWPSEWRAAVLHCW